MTDLPVPLPLSDTPDPGPSSLEQHPPSAGARRFNVGDALILMGALCLGFSGIRDRLRTLPSRTFWWLDEYRRFRVEATSLPPMSDEDYRFGLRSLEYYLSDEVLAWLTSALIALTVAHVLIRLRRPRPGWRALFRQAGFLGTSAASIGFCIDQNWIPFLRIDGIRFPFVTALAVMIAWAALFGLRCAIVERSWIDRLGRLVGIGWILAGFCSQIEQYYFW